MEKSRDILFDLAVDTESPASCKDLTRSAREPPDEVEIPDEMDDVPSLFDFCDSISNSLASIFVALGMTSFPDCY